MAEYTKDEALAFINAMRLTLSGKVGFKWMVEKLSDLAAYVESITAENERLNACLGRADLGDDHPLHCAEHLDVTARDDEPKEG